MLISHKLTIHFCCLFIIVCRLCVAREYCPPSSCGNIPNISFPFRLPNDPRNCGDPEYELTCENNTTLVTYFYPSSYKYIVRAINYLNNTIRLAYPSLSQNNTCSLPNHSTMPALFSGLYRNQLSSTQLITFMSCPYPVNHSSSLLEVDDSCGLHTNMTTDTTRSSYIILDDVYPSDIMEMCTFYLQLLWTPPIPSLLDSNKSSVSLSEIHASLLNGFQLSWDKEVTYSCLGLCVYSCNFYVIWSIPCDDTLNWFVGALYSAMPKKLRIITFRTSSVPLQADKTYNATIESLQDISIVEYIHNIRDFIVTVAVLLVLVTMCHLAIRIILGIAACIWLLIYTLRRRQRSTFDTIEGFLQSNNDLMPIRYSYKEIKKMTKGFHEKLGQGGYGSVYKGKLCSGHIVAVKLLTKPKENGQDFINEIATIGRIHHINVVKLVGFYAGIFSNKRALVFDFMPNGSLEKYILNRQSPNPLSWERKYEIAVGVARGIEYLHTGCDIQILHFDIKPHNILLDDNFTPKVSDFGLAKLYATEKNTLTLTAARGTIGYVAPELINRSIGRVSYKADVYSFGMLLMEMAGQNRDLKANEGESSQYFPDWIYNRINNGKDIETGDVDHIEEEDDNDDRNEKRIKRKMTVVGLWCIQMSPVDRPSMSEVVKMLESRNGDIQIPPRPSVPTQIGRYSDQSNWETESSGSIALLGDDAYSGKCIEMT